MTGPWVPPTLARATVDRAAHLRGDPAALARIWAHPRTRVLRVHGSYAPTRTDEATLAWTGTGEHGGGEHGGAGRGYAGYFLGLDADGVAYFAVDAPFEPGPGEQMTHLRHVGTQLSDRDAGLFVHAVGLANWHARHRFCPACGQPTNPAAAGHVRVCTGCGAQQFPRTDPAVIMLVHDEADRVLLGRNAAWPPERFSTLAGFVEPGESPEQAVAREVAEEVGITVDRAVYAGSQPWPLPGSLMLGFHAYAAGTTVCVDGDELAAARWFTRADLLAAGRRREVLLPSAVSIARWLIEGWYGEPLPTENRW